VLYFFIQQKREKRRREGKNPKSGFLRPLRKGREREQPAKKEEEYVPYQVNSRPGRKGEKKAILII